MKRDDLIGAINEELKLESFSDVSFNGLQVSGSETIKKIAVAVSVSQEVIEAAVDISANLLIVHHGLMWKGNDERLVSFKGARVKTLMMNDLNLAAYHLPLDAHMKLGNNAQIARLLDVQDISSWGWYEKSQCDIGVIGALKNQVNIHDFVKSVNEKLSTVSSVLQFGKENIKKVAISSGGAGVPYVEQAIVDGADVLITGDLFEPMYHLAKEAEIHVIGAGHYASERWGVLALAEWIQDKYAIPYQFIEVENPL